jgi:hypothetical protein
VSDPLDFAVGDRVELRDSALVEFRGKTGEIVETRDRSKWGHDNGEALVQVDDGPRWWFFRSEFLVTPRAKERAR